MLLATIATAGVPTLGVDHVPLVTIGVAPPGPDGDQLWSLLHDYDGRLRTGWDRPPIGPWVAARIEVGAATLQAPGEVLPIIADLERVLAWAWFERRD